MANLEKCHGLQTWPIASFSISSMGQVVRQQAMLASRARSSKAIGFQRGAESCFLRFKCKQSRKGSTSSFPDDALPFLWDLLLAAPSDQVYGGSMPVFDEFLSNELILTVKPKVHLDPAGYLMVGAVLFPSCHRSFF